MIYHLRQPWAALLAAALLAACSKQESPAPAAAAHAPTTASAAAPAKPVATACEMVTQAAMSAILGGAVSAKADEGMGRTGCIYLPASGGPGPAVELRIEWGMAQIAIKGVGMAGRAEPGLASPLAGLGDQAAQLGPALMIASGEDLVTIIASGVDEVVPKAKAILALVKPRL
jgi:hypothetical protein